MFKFVFLIKKTLLLEKQPTKRVNKIMSSDDFNWSEKYIYEICKKDNELNYLFNKQPKITRINYYGYEESIN